MSYKKNRNSDFQAFSNNNNIVEQEIVKWTLHTCHVYTVFKLDWCKGKFVYGWH